KSASSAGRGVAWHGVSELKLRDLRHGVAVEVFEQQHDLEQVRALRLERDSAIVDLEVAAHDADRLSDAAAILAEKLRLEGELVRLQNDSTAVAAGNAEVTPPDPDEITRIKQFADQVDRMT